MRKIKCFMSMVAVALFGFICTSFTTEEKSRVVEDGGTGPYKAIMKEGSLCVWQEPETARAGMG